MALTIGKTEQISEWFTKTVHEDHILSRKYNVIIYAYTTRSTPVHKEQYERPFGIKLQIIDFQVRCVAFKFGYTHSKKGQAKHNRIVRCSIILQHIPQMNFWEFVVKATKDKTDKH